MERFQKSNFTCNHGWLAYDGKFIARFKYRWAPLTMVQFRTELIKNHTVEDYLKRLETSSPVGILRGDNPVWYDGIMTAYQMKIGRLPNS